MKNGKFEPKMCTLVVKLIEEKDEYEIQSKLINMSEFAG